jgi:aspartate dehydrogenase
MRVGLIGFGAIGRGVARAIGEGKAGDAELVAILVRDPAGIVAPPDGVPVLSDISAVTRLRPHVVVEVAGHAALRQYAETVLQCGIDLITVSVGVFADPSFVERIAETARQYGARVKIPSGAIAGLDAIGSAGLAEVDAVTHTVRKHPRAFTPEQLNGAPPAEGARLLYEGPARTGVQLFPENVNVAAAVSLAGIGLDRTLLRVYADPSVDRNVHEVQLCGHIGEIEIIVRNTPSENPKTGRIVALSVAKALRDRQAPLVIG